MVKFVDIGDIEILKSIETDKIYCTHYGLIREIQGILYVSISLCI
jgi:hypothetical protein